jgi:hypothetical protein
MRKLDSVVKSRQDKHQAQSTKKSVAYSKESWGINRVGLVGDSI